MSDIKLLENPPIDELIKFINMSDGYFIPKLSDRVDLKDYASKLNDRALILYHKVNDEIVSLIAGYIDNRKAYITYLFVLPTFRNKKLASNILQAFLDKCVDNDSVELTVNEKNPAMNLYTKNGFNVKRRFEYHNSLENGLIMELVL